LDLTHSVVSHEVRVSTVSNTNEGLTAAAEEVATAVVDSLDAATDATTLVTGIKPVVVAGRVAEIDDWAYVYGNQAAMMYNGSMKANMVLRIVMEYHG